MFWRKRGDIPVHHRSPAELREVLSRLAIKRIFFGHQSVGANILDGVADILREQQSAAVRVADASGAPEFTPGMLLHATVGTNGNPDSKMASFLQYLDAGVGSTADIAVLRCATSTSISSDRSQALFARYTAVAEGITENTLRCNSFM